MARTDGLRPGSALPALSDSPMDADIRRITDVTPAVRDFFGVGVTADAH